MALVFSSEKNEDRNLSDERGDFHHNFPFSSRNQQVEQA